MPRGIVSTGRRLAYLSAAFFVSLLLAIQVYGAPASEPAESGIDAVLETIRLTIPILQLSGSTGVSDCTAGDDENILRYFSHYSLDIAGIEHLFGAVEIGDYSIAVHVFVPDRPRATVVAVHGYYDHAGSLHHLIRYLTGESYAVLAFDFPGHGLSRGAAGDIEDFSAYLEVFTRLMIAAYEALPGPIHVVAHSMGAGIVAEYLLLDARPRAGQVVLIAPNIRSNRWALSRAAHAVMRPFADSVKRIFVASSRDAEFHDFRKHHDPLQVRRIPLRWFQELVEWQAGMIEYAESRTPLLVIQGTSDDTVDFRYNIDFLQDRFPDLELIWINGGEHHLINETPDIRDEVFASILAFLGGT